MDLPAGILIPLIGAVAGAAVWYVLLRQAKSSGARIRHLLLAMFTAGLLCRAAFAIFTPTFYAPDEQAHFKYIQYLAEHRSLPVQTSQTDAPSNDWEYYQPPLYYALLAPFYAFSRQLTENEDVAVRVLRLVSILLWLATIGLTVLFLNGLQINDAFTRVSVMGMISLLPTYTFSSSVINNDNLAIPLGSALLTMVLRPSGSYGRAVAAGLLLGLLLLTKLTAIVILAFIVLFFLAGLTVPQQPRRAIVLLCVILGTAAFVWAPWVWRNLHLYGSITAEEVANIVQTWTSPLQPVIIIVKHLPASFWAVAGIYDDIHGLYPIPGILLTLLAAGAFAAGVTRHRERLKLVTGRHIRFLAVAAAAILLNIIFIVRFALLYGQAQGRFLYVLLLPLSLLLATGWRMFRLSDHRLAHVHAAGFWILYGLCFVSYALTAMAVK